MSDKLTALIEFQIAPGHAEEMKKICQTAVALARSEEGTMVFDQYLNHDTVMISLEVYRDSEALLIHMANANENIERVEEITKITRMEVFGEANAQVREVLKPFDPQYFSHFSGI